MKTVFKNIILSIFLVIPLLGNAQYHRQESTLYFPDLDEYKTYKCDFHIHTAFSDGQVWPDYRVTEAIMDGLDVIAITDHIEYTPHEDYLNCDHNSSFEIAKQEGERHGVLVIKGAEITRSMPPGHLNAIFIQDANKLDTEDVMDAVAEAHNQGGFIFWNHPCWDAQQPDTVIWFDIHTEMYNNDYIDGIEVVNFSDFCPEAWAWAKEKDLTILSNSDIHSTTQMSKFVKHRPITLVFAKDLTESDIRNGLEDKRTALFYNECIYGDEELISQLLIKSLLIEKRYDKENNKIFFDIHNISSAPIILIPSDNTPKYAIPKRLYIGAKSNIHFYVNTKDIDTRSITLKVENFFTGTDEELDFNLDL
ncbi:MAG: histidinol-phosphatase [Marinilabiliales bacterium]|nr:MAG: histidinol-phosphatase [Marinilabiliales bacterium]